MTFELWTSYAIRHETKTDIAIECSTAYSTLRFLEFDNDYKMNWFERKLKGWMLSDFAKEAWYPICSGPDPSNLLRSTISSFKY